MPVTKLQLFNTTIVSHHFDMTIKHNTPRVQFFTIGHHNCVGPQHRCKYHCTAQCTARRHRQVAKCLQQQQILLTQVNSSANIIALHSAQCVVIVRLLNAYSSN